MSEHDRQHVGPSGGGGRLGAARAWVAWLVLCGALWVALIDRVPPAGLVTGVVAAALGATAATLVRQQRRTLIRPRIRWLPSAARPALALATDLWPLTRALVIRGVLRRDERGIIHRLDFDVVDDDPRATAFRVLTATLGSLGPNTIVLDVDTDERTLFAHQLVPTADPASSAMPLERP